MVERLKKFVPQSATGKVAAAFGIAAVVGVGVIAYRTVRSVGDGFDPDLNDLPFDERFCRMQGQG